MSEWQKDRETCEAATEGPWRETVGVSFHNAEYDVWYGRGPGKEASPDVSSEDARKEAMKDAAFIAAARTRWPAALDRIAELEAEVRTAYARGWEDAKKAAVEAVEHSRADYSAKEWPFLPADAIRAIRAVKMGEGKL